MPQGLSQYIYFVALFAMFVIGAIAGGAIVFFVRRTFVNRQLRIAQRKAAHIVQEGQDQAKGIVREAKEEADKTRAAAENEAHQRRNELQRQENRLSAKSEQLDRKLEGVDQRDRNLTKKEQSIETLRAEIAEVKEKQLKQLEVVSQMSAADAKADPDGAGRARDERRGRPAPPRVGDQAQGRG